MIRLSFIAQNKDIVHLEVKERIITYYDKIWTKGVQFIPKDPQFILKLIKARNTIPFSKQIIEWVQQSNSGKNLEQYNNCKTEEELADMVRLDAKSKGLIEVKK